MFRLALQVERKGNEEEPSQEEKERLEKVPLLLLFYFLLVSSFVFALVVSPSPSLVVTQILGN